MVKGKSSCKLIAIICLVILLQPLLEGDSLSQYYDDDYGLTVKEYYTIRINDVGDAVITNELNYDPYWFEENKYIFLENPNLLSRRYRADSNLGEVENFDVSINTNTATVTITFDTPGLAYNTEEEWVVYGMTYELIDIVDERVSLSGFGELNNEFTLFEYMYLESSVEIYLPRGGTQARFCEAESAVYYKLPHEGPKRSFFWKNRSVLLPSSLIFMFISVIFIMFLLTRSVRRENELAENPNGSLKNNHSFKSPEAFCCKQCGNTARRAGSKFCQNCGSKYE